VTLELLEARLEEVAADALLVPVDGQLCKLGGASAGALRAALSPDERDDELEYVADQLARMRPLVHPAARAIDGVARWSQLVVSAAYPHSVDEVIVTPEQCAAMLRRAIPEALAVAEAARVEALSAALIGTAYRMPAELAIRAFLDGVAAAHSRVIVKWSLPDPAHRALAEQLVAARA
jgi:hypothetical protein